ncbi:MAG: hypothetical protein IJZ80_05450 [Clostridia bacterium]|nr:hypothetical protein [Clostridia bacterium]
MKKIYTTPELAVAMIETADILTVSSSDGEGAAISIGWNDNRWTTNS